MDVDKLKCRSIEIVDENGKCQILIEAGAQGNYIYLMGEKSPLLEISSDRNGTRIVFWNEEHGMQRLSLGVSENGNAGFTITDAKGRPKVEIGYDKASDAGIIQCEAANEDDSPELS